MSTRGAITRLHTLQTLSFRGRYVHWDCYPTGLGAELWQAYHGHFQDNPEAMLKVLLDDHPAGWSSLCGADFSQLQAATDGKGVGAESTNAPICYCHGDRNEGALEITERNASGCGCEWVYAFARERDAKELREWDALDYLKLGLKAPINLHTHHEHEPSLFRLPCNERQL